MSKTLEFIWGKMQFFRAVWDCFDVPLSCALFYDLVASHICGIHDMIGLSSLFREFGVVEGLSIKRF